MPAVTKQTLTVRDLYDARDNIGLSRKECKQPPRTRSLFEWGKAQQAYYLDNLLWSITSPPVVYIWEPVDGSGKGAVLDGRQRLKPPSPPTRKSVDTVTKQWSVNNGCSKVT